MPEANMLDRLYVHERERPDTVWLTQPLGGDRLEDFSFAKAMGEARRMAAHLRALELPPASHIVIFAKNNAWWFLADLAIWMAGHVSVPLYPTLTPETIRQIVTHSDACLAFIGKLDGFDAMAPGLPEGLARIADAWTIENGMLTPTLKIKRAALEARYAPHVEAWYATRERVVWFDG